MNAKRPSVDELLKRKKISEISIPRCIQAPEEISVAQAVTLMQTNRAGYILLTNKQKQVAGILTETDVVRKVLGQKVDWDAPVRTLMSVNRAALTMDDSVGKVMEVMGKNRIYHIPLLDKEKRVIGVLSVRSLIRFLAEFYPVEVYNLPPDPGQVMETQEGG